MSSLKKAVESLFAEADIKINGTRPWDIKIKNDNFYKRALAKGSLGIGESYMDGLWEVDQLDEFFYKIFQAELSEKIKPSLGLLLNFAKAKIFNLQSKNRAFNIGKVHYDIGNDLYQIMLGGNLTYTCGYWENAKNLDEAQEAKLDLTCKKIGLKPGDKILDIGCGWGSFVKFAAERYGAQVVGITVSKNQVALGRELTKGLPIEIRLQDYRDVNEKFDHIVSLGMFEHVGYKNYRTYFKIAAKNLKDNGLFLLHTIGGNVSTYSNDPWINKYIFPNGMLPSIAQIGKAIEKLFVMEDWHNFGADYDKTLMAWKANVNTDWDKLKNNYDERFYRMWMFYLSVCAALFRSRSIQLWQIVLSKNGVPGGYKSIR